MIPYLRFAILSDTYLPRPYMGFPLPQDFTCHVASKLNMDLDDECQGILNSNIWNDSYPFFGDMSQEVYKVRWTVLQIATAFLLLSVTRFITNWDRYYKVRWLLQMRKYRVTFLWRHLCAALFNLLASQSWLIDWLLLSIFYLKRPRNVSFMLLA